MNVKFKNIKRDWIKYYAICFFAHFIDKCWCLTWKQFVKLLVHLHFVRICDYSLLTFFINQPDRPTTFQITALLHWYGSCIAEAQSFCAVCWKSQPRLIFHDAGSLLFQRKYSWLLLYFKHSTVGKIENQITKFKLEVYAPIEKLKKFQNFQKL